MTGNLTLTNAGANTGQLNFGVGDQFIRFDGTKFIWQSNTGVSNWHIGDLRIFRKGPNTAQGAIEFDNNGGQVLLWNGTALTFRGYRVMTEETHANLLNLVTPVNGLMMVKSMTVMNGMATAHWERDTAFDARMPIGNGQNAWGDFNDGSFYGGLMIGLASQGTSIVAQGSYNTKNGVNYLIPPSVGVVFARRKA